MVKHWLGQYYSKQEVWTLVFLSVPSHFMFGRYILFFWDFSWIEERSGTWNAIGVGAYALVIALLESVIVLLVALLLGFLIPKVWSPKVRGNVLALIILLISFWAILGQLYFISAREFDLVDYAAGKIFASASHIEFGSWGQL